MTRVELVNKKKDTIIRKLNMTATFIEKEYDPSEISGRLLATIDLLQRDAQALLKIDEYLSLQELFKDN